MTKRTTTIVSAGIAAGAVAAGLAGRALWRRRAPAASGGGTWAPPPEDIGPIKAFDGTKLAVRAAGPAEAPLLLFSHGFSLDMTTWREQWTDLGDEFRCVVLDHRAHGRSEIPSTGDVTLRSMGRDLATVLDAVAQERPAVLIGHSMGAMAILALAEQRPDLFGERIVGVVLLGASASNLLRGAMGGVTGLLRPRLGSVAAAARRVDRLRKAILAGPGDVPAIVARVTQFAPEAPDDVVNHVLHLAERTVLPRVDGRPLGADGDGLPTCAAEDHRARTRRRRRSRSCHAARRRRRARRGAPGGQAVHRRGSGAHRDAGAARAAQPASCGPSPARRSDARSRRVRKRRKGAA